MKFTALAVTGLLAFGAVAPAMASESFPRQDIIRAIAALSTVQNRQTRAEANWLTDEAQAALNDGNHYRAYVYAQRALTLIRSSQTTGNAPEVR
jgi:hypothetical protein